MIGSEPGVGGHKGRKETTCMGGDETQHQQELEPVMLFKVSGYEAGLVYIGLHLYPKPQEE